MESVPRRSVSYHLGSRLRAVRVALLAFGVAGSLLGFMLVSQGAAAYGVNYCQGWFASGDSCEGPNHSLTANFAYDDTGSNAYVCETATTGWGSSVGGWGCGYGYAESCYSGGQLLHGWVANASPYWLYMTGSEYYAQGCP